MEGTLRKQLGAALGQVNALAADIVQRERTRLTEVPASFLNQVRLWRVKYFNPSKPVLIYVAAALPDRAWVTTGHPEAFVEAAQADGVRIATAEAATEYAGVFLEATRAMTQLFYLVCSIEQVRFLPVLSGEDSTRATAFKEAYAKAIVPPAAEEILAGYRVTCFAILGRDLLRLEIVVGQSGSIEVRREGLEENLPLVHGI